MTMQPSLPGLVSNQLALNFEIHLVTQPGLDSTAHDIRPCAGGLHWMIML